MSGKHDKIFVTGMGIISSLGTGVAGQLKKLTAKETGIGPIRNLKTRLSGKLTAGEIPFTYRELAGLAGVKDTKGISRGALLGVIAAREAMKDAVFNDPQVRTGIISGTTAEAMTNIERYLKDFLENDSKNEYIESQDWGFSTEVIARELSIHGYMSTINTACSSAANAIMTGARMIRHGLLDRVLVGGTDALSKVMLNGFHALMIVDPEVCKPFDRDRQGLNIGEGAAFLVIESERTARKEKILCELSGYGNSNEAYHLTALSPDGEGTAMAMNNALEESGLKPEDIDYINAHGTGSLNSDLSEALGLEKVFGKNPPPFSSTKPFTGHTLGSAGALEAVFSILTLQNNLVFPNLNFRQPMEEVSIKPTATKITGRKINHVLSNSFGFGGNNTSLVFSKVQP
ncbi:MAG: beta-ketoacyl-[acyl-carrier-protein] synthase family protein [Bacteroidetes bacterium]|nr:MAG: beta-ketoacyl-[acyl-carrier-protein] synthase family protein [Bacteroidota bacterium]